MKRPIVVEGPDGSGKTTLLNRLSRDLNLPVFHTGGPPSSKIMLEQKIKDAVEKSKTHLLDRIPHISDPVYSRISVRNPFISENTLREELKTLNPIVVYCRLASVSEMFKSIDQTKKQHKPKAHLEEVLWRYKSIVDGYDLAFVDIKVRGIETIHYAWNASNYNTLLERVRCAV